MPITVFNKQDVAETRRATLSARLSAAASRLNRLQQLLAFKIAATAVGLIAVGALAALASRDAATWLPEALRENLASSTVIALLAVVGVVWLGMTISALAIQAVAVPLWMLLSASGHDLWAQIILGIGTLLVLFLLLLQTARLVLSAPLGPIAVARLLLDEAVRMKLALVFIVLLIIYIPLLATQLDEHERLQYRLQTFLSYGTGVSYALLAVLTVFLSTATVAFEQRDKQIFQIASKPLGRFQYLLGKWLGLIVLNAVLLLMTGGATFWFTQFLRTQPAADAYDELAVSEQVLTARVGVRPRAEDFRQEALRLAAEQWRNESVRRDLNNDGRIDDLDAAQYVATQGNEMLSRLQSERLSIPPGEYREYEFRNVRPISRRVRATVRFDGEPIVLPDRIQSLVDLRITSADGRVPYLADENFRLGFTEDETLVYLAPAEIQKQTATPMVEGQTILINYFPRNALTLRFKLNSGENMPDVQLPITVIIPDRAMIAQRAVLVQTQTMLIPAGFVRDDNSLVIYFVNGDPRTEQAHPETITIPWDGLELMYKVDTFEWNYFRAMLIVWLKLGFLAMLGIAAATFASFPVACLLAFTIFFGAESAPFLAASLENFDKVDPVTKERLYVNTVVYQIASGIQWLLRQYGTVRPTQSLIEGRHISWTLVSQTVLWISVLWTGLTALLGWVVFRNRQVAIYSGHA